MTESGKIVKAGASEKLIASLNHPVRAAILLRVAGRPASVGELAADTGEPRSKVRYHAKKLVEAGLIEIAGRRSTRGTAETLYRPAVSLVVDEDEFRTLSQLENRQFSARVVRQGFEDVSKALTSGSFYARPDMTAIHTRLFLDEQGWKEVSALHVESWKQTERIKAAADERLRARGEEGLRAALTELFYKLPGPDRDD